MYTALTIALALLVLSIVLQSYHLIQFTRKRNNMLIGSHVVESHLSKGVLFSYFIVIIIVVIGVLLIFIEQ